MKTLLTDPLMETIDALDAKGGARQRKAKAYSIDHLEKEGYTPEEIKELLGLKP